MCTAPGQSLKGMILIQINSLLGKRQPRRLQESAIWYDQLQCHSMSWI